MNLPFTIEQFLGVFAAYNVAIWPTQIAAYILGLTAVAAIGLQQPLSTRLILSILAAMWALNGIGYHFLFFAPINPAAKLFAGLFVVQAILFAASAMATKGMRFDLDRSFSSVAGAAFIVYAMLIYPILGYVAGHGMLAGPMFGVAPCPTTIFTIGMLLLAKGRWLAMLAIIPFLWSLVGLAAAVQLGVWEDVALPVAGLVLLVVTITDLVRSRQNSETAGLTPRQPAE